MTDLTEQWLPIPGYEGHYEVSGKTGARQAVEGCGVNREPSTSGDYAAVEAASEFAAHGDEHDYDTPTLAECERDDWELGYRTGARR